MLSTPMLSIPMLSRNELRVELTNYISRGHVLRKDVTYIDDNIQNEMRNDAFIPRLFYFVLTASGSGKSQLAVSLSMPVVYIPLTENKLIYKCFSAVSKSVQKALSNDIKELHYKSFDELTSATSVRILDYELATVGLLVALFKEVYGKTNEESIKILSGYDCMRTIRYSPMTLRDAVDDLREILQATHVTHVGKCMAPLFFIDEVPSGDEDTSAYRACVLLRNVIRKMNCTCVLSGTEPALMYALDSITLGSRDNGAGDREYLRLIPKLPKTNWDIFCNDFKYAQIIPLFSPDLCDLLKSTRPLFARHVLDSLLDQKDSLKNMKCIGTGNFGQLTAEVLSNAKEMLLKGKESFTSLRGLHGQLALLHSKLISGSEKVLLYSKICDSEDLNFHEEFRIQHHFGSNFVSESKDVILPLFLTTNNIYTRNSSGKYVSRSIFEPKIEFDSPCSDNLLYLICMRNGLSWTNAEGKQIRISVSYAMSLVLSDQVSRNSSNMKQSSYAGEFLDVEVISAAIVSSHSNRDSLSGCSLDFFLRTFIAELNVNESYVTFSSINDMPSNYDDVRVGLLSPANVHWRDHSENVSDNVIMLQNNTIFLGSCNWRKNAKRSDGAFPLLMKTIPMKASFESKLDETKVPTLELVKTIHDTVKNNYSITLMVLSKFGTIRSNNAAFSDAKKGVNVVIITGNASQKRTVATKLKWKTIHNHQDSATLMRHTIIMIELDSIYYDRSQHMKLAYQLM